MEKLLEKIIADCHFNSDKFDALCEYLTKNGTLKKKKIMEKYQRYLLLMVMLLL